jgi:type I restriction enzyme, S subunit
MSAVMEVRGASATYLSDLQPPLVQHFELMATAPGGVKKLRDLILTLAVQGKLVPQDTNDEPASELLKKIRLEKDQLIAEDAIKRDKPLEQVAEEEGPFDLPRGWEWVRLPKVTYSLGQGAPTERFTYIDVAAIDNKRGVISDHPEVVEAADAASRARKNLAVGAVLFSTVRPYLKNIAVVVKEYSPRAIASTAFAVMQPHTGLRSEYLHLYLRSSVFSDFVSSRAVGIAYPAINDSNFFEGVIALPPTAEQSRIVTRVEELMRLCDALEANGQLEAAQHAQLVQTLLGALTSSATPDELADNWQRVATHFDLLLDRPQAIDALEQTILQLAVRGLLVQQDSKDEPATVLLQKIRREKDRLIADRKIKRDKPMALISKEEVPFEIPRGWAWIRFDELTHPLKPIAYGVLVPGSDVESGVPFVRIADLSITNPAPAPEKSIGKDIDAQFPRTRLEGGEILMGVVGSIGKLGVAPPTWAGANIARAICRIVPADEGLKDFVLFLLQTGFMQTSFAGDTRTLAQPTLNIGLIRQALTPIPPPAEQARIVARVKSLRRLCADMRQCLTARQTIQGYLAESLVDDVT